jgi:hypothetical protein
MSITARSFTGKRQFEEDFTDDGRVPLAEVNPYKRLRASGSLIVSPSGRCRVEDQHLSYLAFDQSSFTTLRSLFPDMTDDQILTVLAEHGDNIDTAINHLTKLRLDTTTKNKNKNIADKPSEQQQQQQQQDSAGEKTTTAPLFPSNKDVDGGDRQRHKDATPPTTTTEETPDGRVPAIIIREARRSLDVEQAQVLGGNGGCSTSNANNNNNNNNKTAEQWVEHLVSEMTQATSVPDAKTRAATILQSFEQTVLEHSTSTQPQQLTEVQRENAILKRAVGIQNAKIQDLMMMLSNNNNNNNGGGGGGGGGNSVGEVAQLRADVQELQQRLHAAEVQNYSLQLHLKQATDGDRDPMQSAFRNPDVF